MQVPKERPSGDFFLLQTDRQTERLYTFIYIKHVSKAAGWLAGTGLLHSLFDIYKKRGEEEEREKREREKNPGRQKTMVEAV